MLMIKNIDLTPNSRTFKDLYKNSRTFHVFEDLCEPCVSFVSFSVSRLHEIYILIIHMREPQTGYISLAVQTSSCWVTILQSNVNLYWNITFQISRHPSSYQNPCDTLHGNLIFTQYISLISCKLQIN